MAKTELEKVVEMLLFFDKKKPLFLKDEISEQKENMEDYAKIVSRIPKRVAKIYEVADTNDELKYQLLRLHTDLLDIEWYLNEVEGRVVQLMKKYHIRDKEKFNKRSLTENDL